MGLQQETAGLKHPMVISITHLNCNWSQYLQYLGPKIYPNLWGVSSNRATPSHHPLTAEIFLEINHPAMGVPHLWTPPLIYKRCMITIYNVV